ncbi:MAG: anti-sigma factor family protein [Anaerolineae bacterium]
MGCPSKGLLRAYLDGELDATQHERVEQHLARCGRCKHLARLTVNAEAARSHLDIVAPSAAPDVARAMLRVHDLRRCAGRGQKDERRSSVVKHLAKRPVLVGGVMLLLLVGLLSFGQGRTLARQFLSVFRVRRFALVQVNPDQTRIEAVAEQIGDQLFVSDQEVVQDATRTTVGSIEEARALAGFDVRTPAYWPEETQSVIVEGPYEFDITFRGDGLRLLLEVAEMDSAAIPEELVEGTVHVASSGAVALEGADMTLVQYAGIEASYPDSVDLAVIVEAGLRVLGIEPDEAQRISQGYDWGTTLLVPVLTEAYEVRQTEVAGSEALLLRFSEDDAEYGSRVMLLMEKDDMLYVLEGSSSFERLVEVAQSLF